MQVDYSKGRALHNLYGHDVFVIEAKKDNRSDTFIRHICADVKCAQLPVRKTAML